MNADCVLLKLPVEVARKVLSSWMAIKDIVQFDSAALVHCERDRFQQLYRGMTVNNHVILHVNLPVAKWIQSREVYVCNMQIARRFLNDWPADFSRMMREATKIQMEPQTVLNSSKTAVILSSCQQLKSLGLDSCKFDADALQIVMKLSPLLQEVNLSNSNAQSRNIAPLLSPRIVSWNLSSCERIDDKAILSIVSACTGLKSLNVDNCTHCTTEALDAIASHCPQLEALDLQMWEDLSDHSMAVLAAGCPDLRSLHIGPAHVLSAAGVRAIAAHCTQLEEVSLWFCRNVKAEDIVVLVSSCSQLRNVNITTADDTVVTAFAQHCPHLTKVMLNDFATCTGGDAVVQLLRGCPALHTLSVSDYYPLPVCHDLRSSVEVLSLQYFSGQNCADSEVSSIMPYMPNLRELRLSAGNGRYLTDAAVLAVAAHCPHLEYVNCRYLERLTDVSIIALAQRCPLLCRINLSGLKQLTDASIISLAQSCRLLRKVNLSDSTQLRDAAVIALAQQSPLLRHINLCGCTLLTDAAVIAIAQHCPQLTHLEFQICSIPTRVNESGKTVMALPESHLTDASIAALAAHSHRLRELNLLGHARITRTAFAALTAALPACTVSKK